MTDKNQFKVHAKHVLDDCRRFRELMGLRSSNPDELHQMLQNLMAASMVAASTKRHTDSTDEEIYLMQHMVDALMVEWPMRQAQIEVGPL